jgi:SAM-dependent methyltransferase
VLPTAETYKELYLADIDRFNAAQLEDLANQPKAIVNREFGVIATTATGYLEIAKGFMNTITTDLLSLAIPDTDNPIEDVELTPLVPMDYSSIPTFSPFTGTLAALSATGPVLGTLTDIPEITDSDITVEDVVFIENPIERPNISSYTPPEDVQTNSVIIPPPRKYTEPEIPVFADLQIPDQFVATDKTFDIVICNHVLEHVPDDKKALSELYRVLKPGGTAILQTPYAPKLVKTRERDPSVATEANRLEFYGQEDHIRLYGTDLLDRICQAGFDLRLKTHEAVLKNVDCAEAGVNPAEPLFYAHKPTI